MGHLIEKKVKCFDVSPGFIQGTHSVFFSNSYTHIVVYDGGCVTHVASSSKGTLCGHSWTHITLGLLALYSLYFSTSFYLKLLVLWIMTLHGIVCGWLLISYRLHNRGLVDP
jgi:hypothetical protein